MSNTQHRLKGQVVDHGVEDSGVDHIREWIMQRRLVEWSRVRKGVEVRCDCSGSHDP